MEKAELLQNLWDLREKLRGFVGIDDGDLDSITDAMEAIDADIYGGAVPPRTYCDFGERPEARAAIQGHTARRGRPHSCVPE